MYCQTVLVLCTNQVLKLFQVLTNRKMVHSPHGNFLGVFPYRHVRPQRVSGFTAFLVITRVSILSDFGHFGHKYQFYLAGFTLSQHIPILSPVNYLLCLKPAWRTRALETSLISNSKITLVLNVVLVVQSKAPNNKLISSRHPRKVDESTRSEFDQPHIYVNHPYNKTAKSYFVEKMVFISVLIGRLSLYMFQT